MVCFFYLHGLKSYLQVPIKFTCDKSIMDTLKKDSTPLFTIANVWKQPVSINRWMDKEYVRYLYICVCVCVLCVQIYKWILHSHKKIKDFKLKYRWLIIFQMYSKRTYTLFFNILFHYRLLQDIKYSSLCYTIGPYFYLSCICSVNLFIPNS